MTKFHTVRCMTPTGVNGPFIYVGPWYNDENFAGFETAEQATEAMKVYIASRNSQEKPALRNLHEYAVVAVVTSFVRGFGPNLARFP